MSAVLSAIVWIVLAVALTVVVRQHLAYFRRTRALSFGAFLETAGWIILLLVALGALAGGLAHPGTRIVEIASAVVGVLFILLGSVFR
jgi:threonine/homoserine/homoserine lactone efflux protein